MADAPSKIEIPVTTGALPGSTKVYVPSDRFPDVRALPLRAAELQSWLLEEHGVATLAGTAFGPGGEGHLRLSYVSAPEVLDEALERLREAIAALGVSSRRTGEATPASRSAAPAASPPPAPRRRRDRRGR